MVDVGRNRSTVMLANKPEVGGWRFEARRSKDAPQGARGSPPALREWLAIRRYPVTDARHTTEAHFGAKPIRVIRLRIPLQNREIRALCFQQLTHSIFSKSCDFKQLRIPGGEGYPNF